jgi:hypothetical protein
MPRTTAADDLNVLEEIAEEIQARGILAPPCDFLKSFLKTKAAKVVADTLEQVARQNLDKKIEIAKAQERLNHLRDDMQWATDAILQEEGRRNG